MRLRAASADCRQSPRESDGCVTKYAIQRHSDQQFWAGTFPTFEMWISEPLAARLFDHMADGQMHAIVECQEPIDNWHAVPIAVPDLLIETLANNERIVTQAADAFLRSA